MMLSWKKKQMHPCCGGYYLPHCLESVVGVHERVDDEVHDDKPSGWSGVLTEGVPAVDEDGDVVIPPVQLRLTSLYYFLLCNFTSGEISVSVS